MLYVNGLKDENRAGLIGDKQNSSFLQFGASLF